MSFIVAFSEAAESTTNGFAILIGGRNDVRGQAV
jgi:hypothetical protein